MLSPWILPFLAAALVTPALTDEPDLAARDQVLFLTAAGRAGVHDADIAGRVVDVSGSPIAGVRLLVLTRLTGSLTALPVATTQSGPDGRFELADLSSPDPLGLTLTPPPQFIKRTIDLDINSHELTELGDVTLYPNTTIRGTVEIVEADGSPGTLPEQVTVRLVDEDNSRITFNRAHALGRLRDGEFVLDEITVTTTYLQVYFMRDRRSEVYRALIEITPGDRERFLKVTVRRGSMETLEGGLLPVGKLGYAESRRDPPAVAAPAGRASGVLRAPDGSPLRDAFVHLGTARWVAWGEWDVTDESGRFSVESASNATMMGIMVCGGSTSLRHQPAGAPPPRSGNPDELTADLREPLDVTLDDLVPLELQTTGIPKGTAVFSFWRGDRWIPIAGSRTWLLVGRYGTRAFLRAEAAGHLPRTLRISLNPKESAALDRAAGLSRTFTFGDAVRSTLTVKASPPAGAVVDIDLIEGLQAPSRTEIASLAVPSDGVMAFQLDPAQRYEVFVHAPGFEPLRASWKAGANVLLSLERRSAAVTLRNLHPGERVRIYPRSRHEVCSVVHAADRRDVTAHLACGLYDAVLISSDGDVRTGVTLEAKPDAQVVDCAADHRPVVTLSLPESVSEEEGWWASVSRGTPAGGAASAMAGTTFGRAFSGEERHAKIEEKGPGELTITFATSGRHVITCSRRGLGFSLAHELDLAPGDRRSLELPPLDGTLKASMNTYNGGKGYSHHGWAGPRLILLSDREDRDASGWDVIVSLPKRQEGDTFLLEHLPAGPFHAFQHLIGEVQSWTDEKGEQHEFSQPKDAWGGVPVMMEPGEVTEIEDFASHELGELTVEIKDRAGKPVHDATLSIRDRMSEAWQQVIRGGSTYGFALDPIPLPPAVRIEAGVAKLPSIRSGRLELVVSLDQGMVFTCTRDVELKRTLALVLPFEVLAERK
ncbi:MAG: carboxypeptidase-like regulatory domain-containing protein [Planctomycetota bacterium]